jgi:hypothetical protein
MLDLVPISDARASDFGSLSDAEAHDVVQETVVSVAKQMRADGYDRSKGTFKNWLFNHHPAAHRRSPASS